MTRRPLAAFPCLLLLGACVSVSSDQLASVRRALPETDATLRAAAPYAWDLRFAGMVFTVYPAARGDGKVIFGSPEGIRVHWDGASIYKVEGLPGAVGLLETGVEGGERWYARDGYPTLRLPCTPRRDWQLSATQRGWRVECKGAAEGRRLSSTHVAEFDGGGDIRRIEATIIPGVSPLVLQRRRP